MRSSVSSRFSAFCSSGVKLLDKTDYNDKTDTLFNDNKQTYKVLKREPTPPLQRKRNNKLFTLKKTDKINFQQTEV